ncbi:EAL domain-containing protein [Noviherbaspirillum sp. CPCC 100848]|uniref:EAL domain-containing protein n=2 Tax=Pseudomonadota TaxID=1224 RepID=A0ABU6J5B1_9BURK|nr:EAL domain-containing protein [Noviherbaspirillum sp. CPCC 100848]MEC4718819.1 EAL domain-containing protein [Noviherbaspirillum sp. CPCC 100848]
MRQMVHPEWPVGTGEMRSLIRARDWSATALGPLPLWPQCLRTAADIVLSLPMPAILLWSVDGVMLYNDAYADLAGDRHPWLLGRKVQEGAIGHTDFHATALKTVLDGCSLVYRDREFLVGRNGGLQPVWLDLDFSPVPGEDGKAAGALAIVTDTTPRISMEQALRSSEAKLSAIFARAKVGLSELSLEGRFLRVNDEICSMLGRSRDDLLSQGVPDVTHPDDIPPSIRALTALLESGESVSLDKRYVHSDGGIVYARSSISRLDDDEGRPSSLLAVTVDLTARKLAEQALADSEARFRALAEASPALIWHLDAESHALYLNQRTSELAGVPMENLLGSGWLDLLHPEDGPAYVAALSQAQRERKPLHHRFRVRGKENQWHWLATHASPWFQEDGSYAGHVGISLDITETVMAEQELLISNERLKLAIEGSGDGVWDWDIPTNKMLYSPRFKEILGLAEDDMLEGYDDWERRVHPDDLHPTLTALRACLAGKAASFQSEYRMCCKDGKWKWVMTRAVVVARDVAGHPLRMTGTVSDISEKRRSEEIIWHHANFDTLTGLPNRRLFRDRLDHDVKKARRSGDPLALLFIDLDRFKEANDLLGHDIGDQLLIEAARRINGCVRASDTVARLGGDEFTAILTDLDDLAHVEFLAQKIIDSLASPFCLGNEVVYLSASIGITLFPSDASTPENLIRNADQAMYAAKSNGRNQFSYFTRSMQQEAHTRLRLIGDLRNALSGNQLRVYYQPVIDLRTGAVSKAEALLRWQHPKLGMIDPPRFIPFAEESGLINEIGEWVFQEAARCSCRFGSRLGKPFQISVNKSPVQFMSRSEQVDWPEYLKSLGLPGSSISVEITEGLLLNASSRVTERLLQYRDAGIQVAIDDFGTGYSSMAYLRRFDIDYLKIDQSFVRDVASDTGDRAIVRSIIAMAHELGLQVIAEGIETAEQKAALIEAGCDYGQGFLFSRAVPPDEFERSLGAA